MTDSERIRAGVGAKELLMEIAWRDFILWAFSNPQIIADFNEATGRAYLAPVDPLAAMIDDATGKTADDAKAFVLWATEEYWGVDEAPESVRAEIAAK